MKRVFTLTLFAISSALFAQADQDLQIQFNHKFDSNTTVDFSSSDHEHTDGSHLQYDLVTMYISNITFTPVSGAPVTLDTVLFVASNAGPLNFDLGSLPTNDYTQLSFNLGIDSSINHSDPAIYPLGHPLSLSSGSFWTWNSGYIFMKIEASVDTSTAQTAGYTRNLTQHLGTDPMLRTVSLPLNVSVLNTTDSINIELDLLLSELLNGMDLKGGTDLSSHTSNNLPTATKLANNIPNAFVVSSVDTVLGDGSVTSINDLAIELQHTIYPNPASGNLQVQLNSSDAKFQLFDLQGREVLAAQLQKRSTVDVSSLEQGMYLYIISSAKGNTTNGKLLIER